MQKQDILQRFVFDETDIRGEIVCLHSSYKEAIAHQDFSPQLKCLLGEFLAAAALLSDTLKFEGILNIQAKGEGKVSLIMAEATHEGNIRGIIRLRENHEGVTEQLNENPLPNLPELLGKAILTITIDPTKGKRYQGIVPLDGQNLAECLSSYFEQSEQLPTQISLFANEEHCGGLFLQSLPAQIVTDLEQRQELWQTASQLASTITSSELFDLEHETLLYRLFHEMNCRIFPAKNIEFKCQCTRERSANAIYSLGLAEATALLTERDIINVDCQFCGRGYSFGEKDLIEIFNADKKPLH